ncbi:peptidase M24, structural domain-containing protein [Melampsora americana]|nr:peptidase M24, structural domain-containing protein [Melampsora americana]
MPSTMMAGPSDRSKELQCVRDLMQKHSVEIYIVPTEDAHGSEYIAPTDARREYITGFTGSAGTALILASKPQSLLFTDGRYFNQASKQLDPSHWTLMKQGLPGVPTWQEYLVQCAASHKAEHGRSLSIGLDPTLVNIQDAAELSLRLQPHSGRLVSLRENLIDEQWGSAKPKRPHQPIIHLSNELAGQSSQSKIAAVRQKINNLPGVDGVAGILVSALDEVAWLLNLRGSDIAFNPVFFSYAWVGATDGVTLFISKNQINGQVAEYLEELGVELEDYESVWDHLRSIEESQVLLGSDRDQKSKVVLSNKSSLAVEDALGGPDFIHSMRSPIQDLKAIKNETEINGFRNAHIRDGAALVAYFAWLEDKLSRSQSTPLTEYSAALELEATRKRMGGEFYRGLSFDTISSTGKNAAVIHYKPDEYESDVIRPDQIYLCDSGAQYMDGTTDVTRTLHFGTPSEEEIRAFTRVLQGHICIDRMVFPENTTGYRLDSFARQFLWRDGLDYRHGTGHGVGHFLNVHEGPQGIGTRKSCDEVRLEAGMTLSNEPGFYKDDQFGIRIESVVVVKAVDTPHQFGGSKYLGFENFTLCPIQTKLVDLKLLDRHEVKWLNDYHHTVYEKLKPLLKDDQLALKWLKKECRAV